MVEVVIIVGWAAWLMATAMSLERRWIAFIFPVMLTATPALIDHIFPYVSLGGESSDAELRLVTSTDLYLLVLVIRYGVLGRTWRNWKLNALLGLLISSLTVNFLYHYGFSNYDFPDTRVIVAASLKYVRFVAALFVMGNILKSDDDLKKIVLGICMAVWVLIVNSVYYSLFYAKNSVHFLTAGTFGNNTFGSFLAICAVFLVFTHDSFSSRKNSTRSIIVLTSVLAFTFSLMTYVRMAVLLLLIGAGVYVYIYMSQRGLGRLSIKFIKISPLLFLMVFAAASNVHDTTGKEKYDLQAMIFSASSGESDPTTSTLIGRFITWGATLNMIRDHPFFGIGAGNFNRVRFNYGITYGEFLGDCHNSYLNILAEDGIATFIIFYSIFFISLRKAKSLLSRMAMSPGKLLLRASVMALVLLLFSDLTNSNLNKSQVLLFAATLLGLIHYFDRKSGAEAHLRRQVQSWTL